MGLEPGSQDEGAGGESPAAGGIAMCTVSGAWSIGWKGRTEPEMGPECLAAESEPSENVHP